MVWIVGRLHSDFRRYFEQQGISYGVFADRLHPPLHGPAKVVLLDFENPDTIPQQLQAHPNLDVSAVITAGYEVYVTAAAVVAAHYELPGPTMEAAVAATDKTVMRQLFQEHTPDLSPDFTEANSWEAIEEFASHHTFPLILKPANLMKSLLISKAGDLGELRKHYEETRQQIAEVYKKHGQPAAPKLLVEEFMIGSMHTVAGFVDTGGEPQLIPQIVDCLTAQDVGATDSYIYCRQIPSSLDENEQSTLLDAAKRAVKALGLTSCPVHVEIILTAQGPKIIEIGARLGGYRPRMYSYAAGIDLYRGVLDTAQGIPVSLASTKQDYCRVIELFPDQEGLFQTVSGLDEIKALPSLLHLRQVRPGKQVGRASQGYRAAAVVILGSEHSVEIEADYAVICQQTTRLEP